MATLTTRLLGITAICGLAAAVAYVALTPPAPPQETGRRAAFKGKGNARGPVPVITERARAGDVPIYLEGLGTVRALNTVTVQPLVDGRLVTVGFKEGQQVKRGEVLAEIDPAIYQAQLQQAKAKLAQDEAQLMDARSELQRQMSLGRAASLQKSIDTAKARVAQLEALVKADEAAVALAETQLGYTRIIAPIDGRTGIRMVDAGNVVRASANSAIVMLTQVQPISVLFNLPQQQIVRLNRAASEDSLAVDALGADGKTVLDSGKLVVIDNQVDQTTGTVRLKAEFANASLQLWPGQFVNARLRIDTLKQVVLVPTSAVQQGPDGTFLFVVGENDKVEIRPIKVGQRDDKEAVISRGLTASERVVTTGFARLRNGSQVVVSEPGAAQPTAASAVDGSKRKGKGKGEWRRKREGGAQGAEARQRDGDDNRPKRRYRDAARDGTAANGGPVNGGPASGPTP